MSEMRMCDVCGRYGEPPFTGWSIIRPDGLRPHERERTDVCSEQCLRIHHDNLRVHHRRNELVTL
jgi:hypothetical protein